MSAFNKIADHWNLRMCLNLSTDPCNKNAKWAPKSAIPRIACVTLFATSLETVICVVDNGFQFVSLLGVDRKIYALDISGDIPKELFELKKLMDL